MYLTPTYTPAQEEEVQGLALSLFNARVDNRGYRQENVRLEELLAAAAKTVVSLEQTIRARDNVQF